MKRPQGFDGRGATAPPPAPPASGAVRDPAPARTLTEPVPLVPPDAGPPDPFPSSREIGRVVRRARKARARVERGEVRRFTRRSRRRRIAWLTAAGAIVVLVLGVVVTAFSPLMAVRRIDVVGTSRLDAGAITRALGDQLGRPLPLVDQGAIRGDLSAFSLIRSYSVESHPPDTIVVRVVERQPIGVVQKGSAFVLVDAAKVTVATSSKRPSGYPLITAAGAAAESDAKSGFAAAAAVLSALPASLRAEVDTIGAHTADDVTFTLRSSHATVVWGSADDTDLKAADLAALLKSAGSAKSFDVSSPHSVTTG